MPIPAGWGCVGFSSATRLSCAPTVWSNIMWGPSSMAAGPHDPHGSHWVQSITTSALFQAFVTHVHGMCQCVAPSFVSQVVLHSLCTICQRLARRSLAEMCGLRSPLGALSVCVQTQGCDGVRDVIRTRLATENGSIRSVQCTRRLLRTLAFA